MDSAMRHMRNAGWLVKLSQHGDFQGIIPKVPEFLNDKKIQLRTSCWENVQGSWCGHHLIAQMVGIEN